MAKRAEVAYSTQRAREAWSKLAGGFLPYQFCDPGSNVPELNALLRQGRGMVGLMPHMSLGDFPRVVPAFRAQSFEIVSGRIGIPVAWHQYVIPGFAQLAQVNGLEMSPITTAETVAKQNKLLKKGKTPKWPVHEENFGAGEYVRNSAGILSQGGVIFCAPQGTRQEKLFPFENQPVRALDLAARKANAQIGYFIIGIEPKINNYNTKRGLNPWVLYRITLGDVLTQEELRSEARAHGNTVDTEVYQRMLALSPAAYRP